MKTSVVRDESKQIETYYNYKGVPILICSIKIEGLLAVKETAE